MGKFKSWFQDNKKRGWGRKTKQIDQQAFEAGRYSEIEKKYVELMKDEGIKAVSCWQFNE